MPRPRDYKGLKFNKLTLIADVGPSSNGRGRIWLAQCDCGNTVNKPAREIAAGRIRTCGKCPKTLAERRGGYRARSAEDARTRALLKRVHRKALREGVEFALSYNDIHGLDLRQCFICTSELSVRSLYLEYVNPAQGYTTDNVVPVCPRCKRKMAGDNLLEHLAYSRSLPPHMK